MGIKLEDKVTYIIIDWLHDMMSYTANLLHTSYIDEINRAMLLGTLNTDGISWNFTDFGEQFKEFKEIISNVYIQFVGTQYGGSSYVWKIRIKLHPNLLTYSKDELVNLFDRVSDSCTERVSELLEVHIVGFDIDIKLSTNKSVNLQTWADFATIGYVYPFEKVNYVDRFNQKFILKVNYNYAFEKQDFNHFAAKDKIMFSVYGSPYSVNFNILETFSTLGIKFGYVYDNFDSKSYRDIIDMFEDLEICLSNGYININTILFFLNCKFHSKEVAKLETLLNSYNIEYYYDEDDYYEALCDCITKETGIRTEYIYRVSDSTLEDVLEVIGVSKEL